MGVFIDDRKRLLIPRWREYRHDRVPTDSHALTGNKSIKNEIPGTTENINSKVHDWTEKKTYSTALEIVNSAYTLGEPEKAKTAALFILEHKANLSPQLKKVINSLLGIEDNITENGTEPKGDFGRFSKFIGKRVNLVKQRLASYPLNPLLWLELSRLHSILGNNERAGKAITVALNLSQNNNRFILRSASRFYHHMRDYEQALYTIRRSKRLSIDPWLISSDIVYSVEMGRYSPRIDQGFKMLNEGKYSHFDLSDLAATIGTLEFYAGSLNKSRRLFEQSLIQPNDNSLAQAEFVSQRMKLNIQPWLQSIPSAYEARAHGLLRTSDRANAFLESCNWLLDEPFSRRAASLSSYIASGLLLDYPNAIQICEFGLRTNPNEFMLLNNLVFSLAQDGQLEKASEKAKLLEARATTTHQQVIFAATSGLLQYKYGNHVGGRLLYRKAISLAEQYNLDELRVHAYINFVREEFLCGKISKGAAVRILERSKSNKDFILFSYELQAMIKSITEMNS